MRLKLAVAAGLALLALAAAAATLAPQDPSKERLRQNLRDVLVGPWVYDDLDEGYAQAKKTGKPLMVVIRCVP